MGLRPHQGQSSRQSQSQDQSQERNQSQGERASSPSASDPASALLLGQPLSALFCEPPSLENEIETYLRRADGEWIPVSVRGVKLADSSQFIFVKDQSQREKAKRTLDFMARLTEDLGTSLDFERTRYHVVRLAVPILADWAVLLSAGNHGIQFSKSYHPESSCAQKLQKYFLSQGPDFSERAEARNAVLLGEHRWMRLREGEIEGMNASRVLLLPLEQKNEITGLLCLGVDEPRKFRKDDLILCEEFAHRAASALENSARFQSIVDMENQILDAKKAAEEASAAKSKFLAVMSHEIRSPLSTILGFTDLLLSEESSAAEKKDWLSRISQNGSQLLRLIDEILDISKIEAGKIELEMNWIRLSELLTQVHAALKPKAEDKGVSLQFRFDSPIPDRVFLDPTRMNQILTNLIGNALKFTSEGSVEVSLRYQSKQEFLVIIVSDTGPGLSVEQASRLFSPFTQADKSHTRRFGGTGLGLVVCRQLARLMGGDVEILETQIGVGSRFQVVLPLKVKEGSSFFTSLHQLD